jgi:hypothetical protein
MSMKDKQPYYLHYSSLFLILGLGVLIFMLFAGYPDRQFLVVITVSCLYFLWGIIYHLLEGDLHPKIVLEYLSIAVIAVLLLKGAIFR